MSQAHLPDSPYRGIQPFRYADRHFFFGREQEIEDLLIKVMLHRLVVVFGGSGAGKSSLINAGLIPALQGRGLAPERLFVRPDGPILAQAIRVGESKEFLRSEVFPDRGDAEIASYSIEAWGKAVREAASRARPVLIFDQFEELFTLFDDKDPGLQQRILNAIFAIINDSQLRAKIVIVIREDFLGRLEVLAKDYPRVFEQRLRLEPLSRENARKAILRPFRDPEFPDRPNPFPSRLTEALADTKIISQLANESPAGLINPTQLQIVCDRLWRAYSGNGPQITEVEFRKLGEVKGILENYLEEVFSETDKSKSTSRRHAVLALRHLVIDSKYRDVVSESRLQSILTDKGDMSNDELKTTLKFLEDHRLINRTPRAGTFYCDIASEYLIPAIQREAQKLDAQLAIEHEDKRLRERAERDARAMFEDRLRRRFIWAVSGGVAAGVFAIIAVIMAGQARTAWKIETNLTTQLKGERGRLSKSLAIEEKIGKELTEAIKKRNGAYNELEKANIELGKAKKAADQAASDLANERTRAIAGELGQRALNRLKAEPDLSVLLALKSILIGQQARSRPGNTEIESEAEASGSLQRTVQSAISSPRLQFERAFSTDLRDPGRAARLIAFSPDGTRLVTGGEGFVRVWDTVHAQSLFTLPYPKHSRALVAAFTADGKRITAVGSDGSVRRWAAASGAEEVRATQAGGEQRQQSRTDDVPIDRAALADGGGRYAVTDKDGKGSVWEITDKDRRRLLEIECPKSVVITVSPNGQLVACVVSQDVRIYVPPSASDTALKPAPASSKAPYREIRTRFGSLVRKIVFSPDSRRLLVISRTGRVGLFDALNSRLIWDKDFQNASAASFGQDGKVLAIGDDNGVIKFLDARAGELLHTLEAGTGPVEVLTVSRDGRRVAAADRSGMVKFWEFPISGYPDETTSMAFSNDGRKFAVGMHTGSVRVTFVSSGRELLTFNAPDSQPAALSLAFSPDDKRLAIGFSDGSVSVWDVWSGRLITRLRNKKKNDIHSIAFSPPYGDRIATGDELGNTEIWDAENGNFIAAMPSQDPWAIYALAFDRDGTRLLTGNESGVAMIFDSHTGAELSTTNIDWKRRPADEEITKVAFAPDGDRFVAIRRNRRVAERVIADVWDVRLGVASLKFSVPKQPVAGATFSDGGKKLITVARDGGVQSWGVEDRKELTTVMADVPATGLVVFDPQGRIFAVAPNDDLLGIFALDRKLAIQWSLMQIQRIPTLAECERYLRGMHKECKQLLEHLAQIAKANGQLKKGEWSPAIATYDAVQKKYPVLPSDLGVQLRKYIAEMLMVDGRNEIRFGNEKLGLARLHDAHRNDSVLMADPENALKTLSSQARGEKSRVLANALKIMGESEAGNSNLEAAIRYFKEAEAADPGLFRLRGPEAEAKRLVARAHFDRGTREAESGNVEAAIRSFNEARNVDPSLFAGRSSEAQVVRARISRATRDARDGNIRGALHIFWDVRKQYPGSISADDWDTLCWWGSLHKSASLVVNDACEIAVKLNSEDPINFDSRGLARALTGRIPGAIEDFGVFAQKTTDQRLREQRERWIRDLKAGKNPFTNEELRALMMNN